jgi:hypothetical protein
MRPENGITDVKEELRSISHDSWMTQQRYLHTKDYIHSKHDRLLPIKPSTDFGKVEASSTSIPFNTFETPDGKNTLYPG